MGNPDAVNPVSEADLLLAAIRTRATGRVRVEAVGRADLTAAEWELLQIGILAGAWEMLDLLDELGSSWVADLSD